jgi:hypothetical protein
MLSAGIYRPVKILDQLQTAAIIQTLGFNGNIRLEAHGEDRLIRKFDVNLGTIATVFVDAAGADYLASEFFAFDHGAIPIRPEIPKNYDELTIPNTRNTEGTFRIAGAYHTHRV